MTSITRGYTTPLYILPFDHRASFERGMFGWNGIPGVEQTARIAAAKRVSYDGFAAAVAAGDQKEKAGIPGDATVGPTDTQYHRHRRAHTVAPPAAQSCPCSPGCVATAAFNADHRATLPDLAPPPPAVLQGARPARLGAAPRRTHSPARHRFPAAAHPCRGDVSGVRRLRGVTPPPRG